MKKIFIGLLPLLTIILIYFVFPAFATAETETGTDAGTAEAAEALFSAALNAGSKRGKIALDSLKKDGEESSVKLYGGLMALTFDDGPSSATGKLLDELKKRHIKATFFVVGSRVEEFSDLIMREYKEGHEIANHTYEHFYLTNGDSAAINQQIDDTNDVISKVIGTDIGKTLVRPPGGKVNDAVSAVVDEPLILWSLDTLDWKSRDADAVHSRIVSQASDGAIILMHDLYETSVDGCIAAIDELTEEGYTFVTVSELYERKGETLKPGVVYTNAPRNGVDLGTDNGTRENSDNKEKSGNNKDQDEGFPWGFLIFSVVVLIVYAVGFVRFVLSRSHSTSGRWKERTHAKTVTRHRNHNRSNRARRQSLARQRRR